MTIEADKFLQHVTNDPEEVNVADVISIIQHVRPQDIATVLHAITVLVEAQPEIAPKLADRLEPLLMSEAASHRLAAARTLTTIARQRPLAVSPKATTFISLFSDDSASVRAAAVRGWAGLAEHHAESIRPHVGELEPVILDGNPFVGEAAVVVLRRLLPDHPDDILPLVDTLIEALVSPPDFDSRGRHRWVRKNPSYGELLDRDLTVISDRDRYLGIVASVIANLSRVRPVEMSAHLPEMTRVLSRESNTSVQVELLSAIGAIAAHNPVHRRAVVATVASVFYDTEQDTVRKKAAWALSWMAEGAAELVIAELDSGVELLCQSLDANDEELITSGLALLSHVAASHPDVIDDALPRIRSLLEAEESNIRGLAIWTLAYAGTKGDYSRIEKLRSQDPDPDVQVAAQNALEILASRGKAKTE